MGEKREEEGKKNDIQKMSHTRLLFSGLGHMVLMVIGFMLHPLLGGLYAVYWLFVIPFLEIRRLEQRRQKQIAYQEHKTANERSENDYKYKEEGE